MCFKAPQRRALFRHVTFQKWSGHVVFCTLIYFDMCCAPQRCALFPQLNIQKCSKNEVLWHFWILLTCKCAVPQRPALLPHLNFQKWSEHVVFWHFWLQNVLRATMACNFSSFIWPAASAPAALDFSTLQSHKTSEKTQCFATFLPSLTRIFSLLTVFISDLLRGCDPWLAVMLFHLSILSEVSLPNFLRRSTRLSLYIIYI